MATPDQRKKNRVMGLALLSVAIVFFIGMVVKQWLIR